MAEPVKLRKWEGPPKKVRAKQEYVPTEASREAEDNIRTMVDPSTNLEKGIDYYDFTAIIGAA